MSIRRSYQIGFPVAITFGLCAVVLATMNVALLVQNRHFYNAAISHGKLLEAKQGTLVPAIEGRGLDGSPVNFSYDDPTRSTLILVFSPTCGVCERNWHQWDELLRQIDRHRVRAMYVNLSSSVTPAFLKRHHMGSDPPVVENLDPRLYVKYHFQLTPQTVLVNSKGVVQQVWTGLLNNQDLRDLAHQTLQSSHS